MMPAEYVFRGEEVDIAMDLVATMAHYLAGPGFDGFLAWCDQQYPGQKCGNCGEEHSVDAVAVKVNLVNIHTMIESAGQ
jgi:hypothetical protein